jgi:hypothetical protein
MKTLSNIFIVVVLLFMTGCKKDNYDNSINFTKIDLQNHSWLQKDTIELILTDPTTGEVEVQKYLEEYFFSSNDTFHIEGELLFKVSDNGTFFYDDKNKEIVFTCEPQITLIGGVESQVWKWTLISYENDILEIDFRLFDHKTKRFNTNARRISYLKK